MKKPATPYTTHDMGQAHSHDTPSTQDVPIVGDSSNSEWDPEADTLHQGGKGKPTTEVNTVKKSKIYK